MFSLGSITLTKNRGLLVLDPFLQISVISHRLPSKMIAHNRFVGGGAFFDASTAIIASTYFLKSVRIKNAIMAKTMAIWRCDAGNSISGAVQCWFPAIGHMVFLGVYAPEPGCFTSFNRTPLLD
jgi:hypothetical protein